VISLLLEQIHSDVMKEGGSLKNSSMRPKLGVAVLYLLPGILLYTLVVVIPIFNSFRLSFFRWSGGLKRTFIGLENYYILFQDSVFWQSFRNNIIITLISIVGQIGIAFIFSSFLYSRMIKFKSFHRVVVYFPATISAVVVGFVWSFVFNYDYGLINQVLEFLNLGSLASTWLDNPNTIIYIVSFPIVWQYIGFYMVIILSAMTSIDKHIYEMSEIDGANGIQKAIKITLPLIKRTMGVTVMLCIAGNMRIFDHIYVMTGGGPGTSSMVMALHVYKTTFIKSQFGYASAISVAILVLSLTLILISKLLINRPWARAK